jgi:hypothetical protein
MALIGGIMSSGNEAGAAFKRGNMGGGNNNEILDKSEEDMLKKVSGESEKRNWQS